MDASIAPHLVFAKTPKGVAEINARSGALTLQARRVLIMIDGRRAVAELLAVVRNGEFAGIMTALEQQGMIEQVDTTVVQTRDFEEEDFADTISLLQENAAALRAMPNLHPADVAQAALQERPATLGAGSLGTADTATDAAAIAARAVANASAPRVNEPAMRRPPTISVPGPMSHDMASGKARPGTINTVARTGEPARPPMPGAVRAPLAADVDGMAVATPVRAAAAAAARAEPPPAPTNAAAGNTPARSLEEEKRFVVSELYSILGPYGEQTATKLMECATPDALREQVKVAGKRVVTFRGEKAAQDFLRAVGYA
jgi:hypothetical protein